MCSGYFRFMALVRILVDGYSLLHSWPELAPGRPRHSAAAREELIHRLRLYQDAGGTPITIVFDGGGGGPKLPKREPPREMEVLYSRAGRTAHPETQRPANPFTPHIA